MKDFLDGIVAEGGGDWEEAVKDGLEAAMKQLKWRADAKKVIILVGSSPPHEKDVPAIRNLVRDWQARGRRRQHHRREPAPPRGARAQAAPLALRRRAEGGLAAARLLQAAAGRASRDISHRWAAAQSIALGQDQALVRYLLVLTFGPQWEKDVSRVARNR